MDERFFTGLAHELEAKLRRVSAFTGHAASIGSYHEEALRNILRSMLPDRFSLRTGFAYHPKYGTSKQGDILIVDESHPDAYLFRENDFAIVSPGALVCVIEVKTRLSKSEYLSALETLDSFHRVSQMPRDHPICARTFLFAYEGGPLSVTTLPNWYAASKVPDHIDNYPWAVLVLDRGALMLRAPTFGIRGHAMCFQDARAGTKERQRMRVLGICAFLHTIRKAVQMYGGVERNPFAMSADLVRELLWSDTSLRFGKGAVTTEGGALGA